MKKKISLLLCLLVVIMSLVGCSGKTEEKEVYDTETMESTAETLVSSFSQMDAEAFAQMKELEKLSDFQLEVQMLNLGLNVSGENFLNIIRSWEAAVDECGVYSSKGDFVVEEKSKEIVISALAQFEERDATIAFAFDKNGMLESLDVSAKYTIGEILTKAGLNTLLGMGVVFAVLIFLAFIISLMKFIPMLLSGKPIEKKPKKVAPQAEVQKEEVAAIAATMAAATDDSELIAVITAAIAMQEGTSTDGFVVRSIRRRPSNNW